MPQHTGKFRRLHVTHVLPRGVYVSNIAYYVNFDTVGCCGVREMSVLPLGLYIPVPFTFGAIGILLLPRW